MSDGLTDCARSNRIAGVSSELMNSEISFLVDPTQEKLLQIYGLCSKLKDLRGGYWGESGERQARRVAEHYERRFGREYTGVKLEAQDIVVLLEKVHGRYQIEFLAEIITRRTLGERESYSRELGRRINELRGEISLRQKEDLEQEPINHKTIEEIFSGIGFEL